MVTTALVLADTHLRTGSGRWLPDPVVAELRRADAVLHAGDVLDEGVLERLRHEAGADRPGDPDRAAPLHAVLGNNDTSLVRLLPLTKVVDLAGVRIGMIHDSGRSAGREARLHRSFPDCGVVVFGHSHAPLAGAGVDGQLLFNPGSPTQRRQQPHPTYGLLRLQDGAVLSHRIVPL